MSLTPLTFTGISTYSSDFQQIINRAVSIASIPLQSLQNQQTDILQQKTLVGNLSAAVATLSQSLAQIGTTSAGKSLVASSSDASKVTATNINSTSPATYTLTNITSLAKVASETSVLSYADASATPVASTPSSVELTVGDQTKTLDISGNNTLTGLRDAINSSGLGVTATILTVSPTENYLSISANQAGATTLKLVDDPSGASPVNLLTNLNQGADTVFTLNGAQVSRNSTTISDLIPGVVLNVQGTTSGNESVDVSLATDRSSISNALQSFVTAYNAVVDQVNGQVGQNAGLLSGDYLVRLVQDDLRQISAFPGSGSIHGLADLGIEFDSTGKASFNADTFNAISDSQMSDVFTFLGSQTTGLGGMSGVLDQISDPLTGLAKLQQDQYDRTDQQLTDQIANTTDQINQMQQILSVKLQSADALLGQMQSQQTVLDASIKSLNLVLYGPNTQSVG